MDSTREQAFINEFVTHYATQFENEYKQTEREDEDYDAAFASWYDEAENHLADLTREALTNLEDEMEDRSIRIDEEADELSLADIDAKYE